MKSEIQSKRPARHAKTSLRTTRFCCRFDWPASPSIRMAVTPSNRGALRLLRAAEMQAWLES